MTVYVTMIYILIQFDPHLRQTSKKNQLKQNNVMKNTVTNKRYCYWSAIPEKKNNYNNNK